MLELEPEPPLTLRQVLESPFHLAMAPANFGFCGYLGALAAWQQALQTTSSSSKSITLQDQLQSVAGASAGAMVAILLGAGANPQDAASFCANIKLSHFADYPGFFALFRGNKFEAFMQQFLLVLVSSSTTNATTTPFHLEDAVLPVAVTAFDLLTMQLKILTRGSMARAARASVAFPFLYHPVAWKDDIRRTNHVFVDGGIVDREGLFGLTHTLQAQQTSHTNPSPHRVINLSIGGFSSKPPPGPESLPGNTEVVSISIQRLPEPFSWDNMFEGKQAFDSARAAMEQSLDVPLQKVVRQMEGNTSSQMNHYELHIEAHSKSNA